jgi:multisubunit Na+/H+ antiporter MnhE subunit
MKSITRRLLTVVCCAAIYSLTLASDDPIDFGIGLLIGIVVAWLLHDFMSATSPERERPIAPPLWKRVINFPVFVIAVLRDVTAGTIDVARYSLGFRKADYQGIVALPIGERTKSGVAVSAWATTLSPGTALVDVDWDAGQILIHVIDASNPDAIREAHQRFYDRYQRNVFP